MGFLFDVDFSAIFSLESSLLELFIRASVLYFALVALMRLMPRRTGGELAPLDIVFLLLIAGAATDGFGAYTSVADSLFLIGVLMAWDYTLNLVTFRFPAIERVMSASPLPLVRDGTLLRRNLRREFITEQELMEELRAEGIDDLRDVKSAYVEGDGHITVVPKSASHEPASHHGRSSQ